MRMTSWGAGVAGANGAAFSIELSAAVLWAVSTITEASSTMAFGAIAVAESAAGAMTAVDMAGDTGEVAMEVASASACKGAGLCMSAGVHSAEVI